MSKAERLAKFKAAYAAWTEAQKNIKASYDEREELWRAYQTARDEWNPPHPRDVYAFYDIHRHDEDDALA